MNVVKGSYVDMLERLACSYGRNDEVPNIELAEYLAETKNPSEIKEIVDGLTGKDKAVANDCIKVLYELGERNPVLIQDYVDVFLHLLLSKNNRLAWGSMTALALIAPYKAKEIFDSIAIVKKAYDLGSVITVDQSMTVFANLCKANKEYEKDLFPFLIQHLSSCRPKEVAQHAERIAICVNKNNYEDFIHTLQVRKPSLTLAQQKRLDKLIRSLAGLTK